MRPSDVAIDVFDFDGTLISVNSYTQVCKATLLRSIALFQFGRTLEIVILYAKRKILRSDHLHFKKMMMQHFESVFDVDERNYLIQKLFEKYKIEDAVRAFYEAGNCVISTSAPHCYMSLLELNRNFELIASLQQESSIVDSSNMGNAKLENLRSRFGKSKNIVIQSFYTDDLVADKCLVDVAQQVYLVERDRFYKISKKSSESLEK